MSKKEEPLLKPPHLEDIDPNTAPAHSSNLKLVSRSTMIKERALEGLDAPDMPKAVKDILGIR